MNTTTKIVLYATIGIYYILSAQTQQTTANEELKWDNIYEVPEMPENTIRYGHEKRFSYRGRIGFFLEPPSVMGALFDSSVNYLPSKSSESPVMQTDSMQQIQEHMSGAEYFGISDLKDKEIWAHNQSIKFMYNYKPVGKSFCGAYIMILGDLTQYQTMTFMIKGAQGGEIFQLGLNDNVSNKREDAVFIGTVNRFLPKGVSQDWQVVKIPINEFHGSDLKTVMSIIFDFQEEVAGTFWVDDLRFYKEQLVFPMKDIYAKGYLLLDNFDYSLLNLLGRKTNTYKQLPSVCRVSLDNKVFYGDSGKSLKIEYNKAGTGWCGYYSMLNQIDGEWYDLSEFDRVSFMVKGQQGGENFEIGMADKSWVVIGDSLKAGSVNNYLPTGVTTKWQEVTIPLSDFGALDLSEMGSFVINFNYKQESSIWIDDLKFHLKEEDAGNENIW